MLGEKLRARSVPGWNLLGGIIYARDLSLFRVMRTAHFFRACFGSAVYEFLDGCISAYLVDGRLQFLPQRHKCTVSIKGAIPIQEAADAGRGLAAGFIEGLENLVDRYFVGRSLETKTAGVSTLGRYDASMFQLIENDLQKTLGDGLGLSNYCGFKGRPILVLGQFINGSQRILFLLIYQHSSIKVVSVTVFLLVPRLSESYKSVFSILSTTWFLR
jgi:hypothetical protein